MSKEPNYTNEQADTLRALYLKYGTDNLIEVVDLYNKAYPENQRNIHSIRGKIMTMKDDEGNLIYKVKEYVEKAKVDKGPSKDDLLAELAKLVTWETQSLKGATKAGIQHVLDTVKKLTANG